ncbi:MAG: hypothetical protein JXA33_03560 [Anaerolineae bacterium]|nr:hypothetical protein [Anaerolineae bacterium]
MESSQVEQMIRWLDEERKRDKAMVLALQERIEQQMQVIEAQAVEIENLHHDIANLRTDLRRTDDYPEMVQKTHRDLSTTIDDFKETIRRQKAEGDKLRRAEIELLNELIGDLDQKIRPFSRYEEMLRAREAGEYRIQTQLQQLTNELADLGKRTEDRLQSIVYIEEQRRADTRRITAVEGEVPPLRQSMDELAVKFVRLEDSIRKIPARVDEAIQVAKSYDPRIEELRVADFQREQRMKQYADQAERVNEEVTRLVEQTQRYALLYNQNKQALDAMEAFQVRIEKRQNEMAEMQRIAEERLRRQWEEWQAVFARDWQKRLVSEEDRWRRQDLANQRATEHFASVDEQVELFYRELVALWEEMLAALERWNKSMREAFPPHHVVPTQRLKDLRRFAEEKHKELL